MISEKTSKLKSIENMLERQKNYNDDMSILSPSSSGSSITSSDTGISMSLDVKKVRPTQETLV
ncbi:unnamed protein product [Brachionus calyciflorus]|uniref:Uncharacterized protein n=1 Tax=Brachionus calyciflorus TaxID=104777 RepID=A0A814SVM5_9BILA|nr:unnamed protein product [Brachionus calyciflorus]